MNNNTNIPKRYEHEIPEGYEARIEGGKVVIELKESEDERIRQIILRCCYDWDKGRSSCVAIEDVPAIRAYLERLKEQKPVISDEAIRDGVVHFGITQYQIDNWLKKHINVIDPQPAEWSEEDEKMLWGFTAWIPEEELAKYNITRNGILEKLKSLRPQSKQEWSEEDINNLNRIAAILVEASYVQNWWRTERLISREEKEKLIGWLKALYPSWKPSEVQMDDLSTAEAILREFGYVMVADGIAELHDDLEKL